MQDPISALRALELLISLARAAHSLADDTEENDQGLKVDPDGFTTLCTCLDGLDTLPDISDEVIGTGPALAEHAVRFFAGMKLKALPPTEPGWYWCQNLDSASPSGVWQAPVRVDRDNDGLFATWLCGPGEAMESREADWDQTALWSGPIPEPALP